jgi:hypothetical protein
MSLTKLFLVENNLDQGESLVSDIPAGDGKIANLFRSSLNLNPDISEKSVKGRYCKKVANTLLTMLVIDRVRGGG